MEMLTRRGYEPATFADLVRGNAPERAVAVTFDDGYLSVHRNALPVLSEFGAPATVFVATELAGRPAPLGWLGVEHWRGTEHEDELMPMDWDTLGSLRELGWEIGSHTRTHPNLTRISGLALDEELEGSRDDIRRELGAECLTMAFPYGAVDERVSEAAERAGFVAAASMRPFGGDRFSWPRTGVYPIDRPWRFALKIARPVRRFRATRACVALERSRYAVPAVELVPIVADCAAPIWVI
jgi:peptidoglycan/xylan/chitin deacetylase (PgdA/CDA1 family)